MTEMANMLHSKNICTSVVTYSSYYKTYEYLVETTDGKLIPMNDDFCDAMYEVICSKTPGTYVVLANEIKSGFFKEPLVKGGTCDTDGDTLSDSDEVDWNSVKKVYKDGTYELYTWGELCEKTGFFGSDTAYTDGKLNPLFRTMSDYEVIPVTSNPFSADSDNDYYPDNVDDNKLKDTPMYIFDGGIKDFNFHDGNPIEKKTSDKYTDGELIVDNTDKTAKYSFVRRPRDNNYTFSLKPDERSFYKFNLPIDISYEKGWWFFSETVYVEPESDGTYLLEKGTEYTIEIQSNRSSEYVFTVEQDNWEYAGDGGVWEANDGESLSEYYPIKEYYITPELLVKSLYIDIDNDFEITTVYTQADIQRVIEELDPKLRSQINEDLGKIVTAGGFAILIVDKLTHGAVKMLKLLGDTVTVLGFGTLGFTWIEDIYIEHIEDVLREGNLHICYSTYMFKFYDNYNPWTTERYIRKLRYNIAGSVSDSLSYKTVQDVCGFPNYNNT